MNSISTYAVGTGKPRHMSDCGEDVRNDAATDDDCEEFEYEYEDSGGEDAGGAGDASWTTPSVAAIPAQPPSLRRGKSHDFKVLDAMGLKDSMETQLARVSDTFGVSFSVASALLRHFHWNFARLAEAFTDNPAAVLCYDITCRVTRIEMLNCFVLAMHRC